MLLRTLLGLRRLLQMHVMALLNHPHVTQLMAVSLKDTPMLAMKYIPGAPSMYTWAIPSLTSSEAGVDGSLLECLKQNRPAPGQHPVQSMDKLALVFDVSDVGLSRLGCLAAHRHRLSSGGCANLSGMWQPRCSRKTVM